MDQVVVFPLPHSKGQLSAGTLVLNRKLPIGTAKAPSAYRLSFAVDTETFSHVRDHHVSTVASSKLKINLTKFFSFYYDASRRDRIDFSTATYNVERLTDYDATLRQWFSIPGIAQWYAGLPMRQKLYMVADCHYTVDAKLKPDACQHDEVGWKATAPVQEISTAAGIPLPGMDVSASANRNSTSQQGGQKSSMTAKGERVVAVRYVEVKVKDSKRQVFRTRSRGGEAAPEETTTVEPASEAESTFLVEDTTITGDATDEGTLVQTVKDEEGNEVQCVVIQPGLE